MHWKFEDCIAHVSRSETLHPGEFFGSGTVGNGWGLEPAASNRPVSRSYQVIRDIGSVVDHIRQKHKVAKVTLIGWSWGAMTAGYYTSLNSEKVKKLVMYAPAYSYPLHTNLGAGSGL